MADADNSFEGLFDNLDSEPTTGTRVRDTETFDAAAKVADRIADLDAEEIQDEHTAEQKRDYRIQEGDSVRHRRERFFGVVVRVQFRVGFEVMLTVRREEVVFKTNSPELYDVLTLGRESRVRDIHL